MDQSFVVKFTRSNHIFYSNLHVPACTQRHEPNLDQTKAKALVDFISWAITNGQKLGPNLGYVPLPTVVVKHNQDVLKSLTFKGTHLYTGQ
jgi:hypothetical protein